MPSASRWRDDRERADPGGPWRRALAADRSGAMDCRGVPDHHRQADARAGSCAPWAIASCRPARAIMPRPRARSRILKKLPRAPGRRSRARKAIDRDRIEVWFADEARIGQKNKITRRWAQARHAPQRAPRSAHRLDLHLRRHLPERGQGRGPGPARLQHRGDEPAPGRDRHRGRARSPCRPPPRPGRMASLGRLVVPANITLRAAAAQMPRAQPGRERLAVHARQLALEPRLQILRRSPRPLLRRLEQARRPALDASCPSACAIGRIGSDQRELVLVQPCLSNTMPAAAIILRR